MFKKYRKKPVVISAMQWKGNYKDVAYFLKDYIDNHQITPFFYKDDVCYLEIRTLEGVMLVNFGDWIIIGVEGEIYPCKDNIFKKTYEEVKDANN